MRQFMTVSRREFLHCTAAVAVTAAASKFAFAAPSPISLAAVGDCMITRRISMLNSPAFTELITVLRSADVTFGNFEMTLAEADAPPAYHEGCAYVHLRA